MDKKINLIPSEGKTNFEILVFQKKLKKFAISLTGFFVVFSLILFSIIYRFNSELEDISQKINFAENKVKSQITKEGSLLVLKNRLGFSQIVIKDRAGLVEIINYLQQASPEGVSFEVIESISKNGLRIGVNALNLNVLNEFIKNISDSEFSKKLIYLNLSSISRSDDGIYSLIIELAKA